jgi:DNA-directed RNA polymerase specialized sigma24 family protein
MSVHGDGHYPTTHWTLIARLRCGDAAEARRAIEELCAQYRFPLYCAIRRRGLDHHDAEDALHDFLGKLLRLDTFAEADAGKGRLRAFLATALQRFLINWHESQSQRRREVSLDAPPPGRDGSPGRLSDDENRYRAEQFPEHDTPEQAFDRQWARELLTRVFGQLRAQYAARHKSAVFEVLSPVLLRGGSLRGEDFPVLASALGLSGGALRTAHHRLLHDYRALLEAEVFQSVSTRAEVDAEIGHLMTVFQRARS